MATHNRPRVYLAGPDVFLPNALEIAAAKKRIAEEHGLAGVFPLDNVLDLDHSDPQAAGFAISAANEDLMRGCDAIIAHMTPFRGPGMDNGTAFEMGFMRALGRPVAGYTNDPASFAARTRAFVGATRVRQDGAEEDPDGLMIEDFGLADNLMMPGSVAATGLEVVVQPADPAERYTDLTGFRACCAHLSAHFARTRRRAG